MKRWVRIVAVISVVLVVLGAVPIVWIWTSPAHFLRTAQGWSIDGALGGPEALPTASGDVMVWRAGSGAGPTYVLVHGFGDAGAGWTTVASTLAADHHVVVLDLPGHGRSDTPEGGFGLENLVAGLGAVVETIDGPVVLVGNSLGGWVSTLYALEHPDRVQELVLVNSAGFERDLDRDVLLPETREGIRRKNIIVMGDHAPDMPDVMIDGLITMHQEPRLHAFFDRYPDMPKLNGRIAGLTTPMRLVWGAPDAFFPVEGYLEAVRSERPEAPHVVLDGCGHSPQYSCPDQLVDALLAPR